MARTNFLAENFFGQLKHDERRRSGRKNLTQDLEHLPPESALVYNLEHADYVTLVCGSLDRLAEAFAHLDQEQREKHLRGLPAHTPQPNLGSLLQLESASLSTADRRVIRTEGEKGSRGKRFQGQLTKAKRRQKGVFPFSSRCTKSAA